MRYGLQANQVVRQGGGLPFSPVDAERTFLDARLPWQIARRVEIEGRRAAKEQARLFLDEVVAAQLTLAINVDAVERVLEHVAYDPSSQAAANTLRERLEDLRDIGDALEQVYLVGAHPDLVELFDGDSPLADYLRGVEAWSAGAVSAFEKLAVELRAAAPDWATLRGRLESAAQFHMADLVPAIPDLVERLRSTTPASTGLVDRFMQRLSELFAAADWFAMGLAERFG